MVANSAVQAEVWADALLVGGGSPGRADAILADASEAA